MNLLVPWGFYGWGNIGDEATLQGFARLVARARQGFRVWAGSRNPRHTNWVEPSFRYFAAEGRTLRWWWAKRFASAAVVVGGTPIMDALGTWPLGELIPLVEDAGRRGQPVAFVGTGTESLSRAESRCAVVEKLVPQVVHWSVRSERDKQRLNNYGVAPEHVTVASDLAWLLDPVSTDWGREQLQEWGVSSQSRLVGVNVLNEKAVQERAPHLLEQLARFLDTLIDCYDVFVLFIANEVREGDTFDKVASLMTLAAMRHRDRAFLVPNKYWSPQQVMSLIANCRATVSMRYHFCLFSALQSVPFLSLNRSDKVTDLCWDLEWPFQTELNELRVCDLVERFDRIHHDIGSASSLLRKQVSVLRARAEANIVPLNVLQKYTECTIQ